MPSDRDAWLARRRRSLGSSDVAAVVLAPHAPGEVPWGNPLTVYLDKLGQWPGPSGDELRWGQLLEPVIAQEFAFRTGRRIVPAELVAHPDESWAHASRDYLIEGDDGWHPLEVKNARVSEGWGEPGTDEVPRRYLVQVQWQLWVGGGNVAELAVLFGGNDLKSYRVERNERVIEALRTAGALFWREHVERRVPPAPDWTHPLTTEAVALLHAPRPGVEVELGVLAQSLADEYRSCSASIKRGEVLRDLAKGRLIELLGGAAVGLLPDGSKVRHTPVAEAAVAAYTRKAYCVFSLSKLKEPSP